MKGSQSQKKPNQELSPGEQLNWEKTKNTSSRKKWKHKSIISLQKKTDQLFWFVNALYDNSVFQSLHFSSVHFKGKIQSLYSVAVRHTFHTLKEWNSKLGLKCLADWDPFFKHFSLFLLTISYLFKSAVGKREQYPPQKIKLCFHFWGF